MTPDRQRLAAIAAHPTLNGIDWLEVLDGGAPAGTARQRTLLVRFVKTTPSGMTADTVLIEGGTRETVRVVWAAPATAAPKATPAEQALFAALPDRDRVLVVRTDGDGDFSTYRLRLRRGPADPRPPVDVDPRAAAIDFSFKVECPADQDCLPACDVPGAAAADVDLDTLARDYPGFRRLLLDRMRTLMPGWSDTNPADLGVTLAELLATVGDQIAYAQDAVSAESTIGTARRRTSLRRHALLVDYRPDEGANARAFVQLTLAPGVIAQEVPLAGVRMLADTVVFEPVAASALLDPDHDAIAIHRWGSEQCLPEGAVAATLAARLPSLVAGDVLIFEERLGPETGEEEHADPTRRHAVRLTEVRIDDTAGDPLIDPLTGTAVTEIEWDVVDALPFALCLVAEIGDDLVEDISVARGNIVLVDHGETIAGESIGPVADGRFRPGLARGPIVHRRTIAEDAPAASLLEGDGPSEPQIALHDGELTWSAVPDLLLAQADDERFVVEIEHDGSAALRFGDGRYGRRPAPGTMFAATYRIGGGRAGNVGADRITTLVTPDPRLAGVRNPMAARGGAAPETAERIRRRAGQMFRRQERAVTLDDWAALMERQPRVARAAAASRWTGSWRTAFVAADMVGGTPATDSERTALEASLDRYRLAGREVALDEPVMVSLVLDLFVCVAPGAIRSDVAADLRRALGSGLGADGKPALFHPDRLTFGQTIHLSPIYATARAVPGVRSVEATRFGRADAPHDKGPLGAGLVKLGRGEIARLDSDPDWPERGSVRLTLQGGR